MATETQLDNLRAQLEAKRRKVLEDPDIPSQTLDQITKEMHSLFHEIQALEKELQPDVHPSPNHTQ